MKRLLLVLVLLLLLLPVLALAALWAVPRFVDDATIKAQVEGRFQAATGREMVIDGPVAVQTLPRLQVRAERVRIANTAWGEAEHFATLEALDIDVGLATLLTSLGRTLEVDRFVLQAPDLALEVGPDGQNNWTFAQQEAGQDAGATEDEEPALDGEPVEFPFATVRLGEVALRDGQLRYIDQPGGTRQELRDLNLELDMATLDDPLRLIGDAQLNDRPLQLALNLQRPLDVLAGTASDWAVELSSESLLSVNGDGSLQGGDAQRLQGQITAETGPLADLGAWLDVTLPEQAAQMQGVNLSAQLDATPAAVDVTELQAQADDIRLTGQVSYAAGDRPNITGQLETSVLDLNRFLPASDDEALTETGEASAGDGAAGWPSEPLDLPLPLPVDANVTLDVAGLRYGQFEIGATRVQAISEAERAVLDAQEVNLYGGQLSARAEVAPQGAGGNFALTLDLQEVQAQPLLEAAAEFTRLAGTATASADLTTSGASVAELMQTLNGTAQLRFNDGALNGINIAAFLRDPFNYRSAGAQSTDFAELSGSFALQDGVAQNDDLTMLAPLFRLTGQGQIDVGGRQMDYRVEPKASATLEGQGGVLSAAGLSIPVNIRGPWDDLAYRPDFSAILSSDLVDLQSLLGQAGDNPQLLDAIRERTGESDPRSAIESLLGDAATDEGGGAAAQQLLQGLFGGGEQGDAAQGDTADAPAASRDSAEDEQTAPDPAELIQRGLGGLLNR